MSVPENVGPQGSGCEGLADGRKIYNSQELPPGAVAVKDRVLARIVPPGTRCEPHGVPPIGVIGLPAGWVLADDFTDEEEIRVLPFRFPWASRAYGLRNEVNRLVAVVRNVQPFELNSASQVVVQYNETGDWTAIFGKIRKLNLLSLVLKMPDGEEREIKHEEIHFVGKIVAWWDE